MVMYVPFQGYGTWYVYTQKSLLVYTKRAPRSRRAFPGFCIQLRLSPCLRFWASQKRPSEQGSGLDSVSAMESASRTFPNSMVFLWGRSQGVGVAPNAAAEYTTRSSSKRGTTLQSDAKRLEIKGPVLETPFTPVCSLRVAVATVSVPPPYLGESPE